MSMNVLTAIDSRTSALKLSAPGPTREHIERIVHAGTRAPDHGRLRPWRFAVLEAEGIARLGDAMVERLREKLPEASSEQIEAERAKAHRAPTIIVAAARISSKKIPEIDQICAVAAAAQNMFLAARALGYGVMWKTGKPAYDERVKALCGLESEDRIVAFLYIGTTAQEGPLVPAPDDAIVRWL